MMVVTTHTWVCVLEIISDGKNITMTDTFVLLHVGYLWRANAALYGVL